MSFALTAKATPRPPPPRTLEVYRGVMFREERFSWLRYEAGNLFYGHYFEASADLSVPLEVNWPLYEQLEQSNLEVCVVARRDSVAVGYAVYFIVPHLHYDQLVAENDVFYLAPEERRGDMGMRLFRHAEQLLRERGVDEMLARVKKHVKPGRGRSDLGPMFEHLGYRPIETVFRKRLR